MSKDIYKYSEILELARQSGMSEAELTQLAYKLMNRKK